MKEQTERRQDYSKFLEMMEDVAVLNQGANNVINP